MLYNSRNKSKGYSKLLIASVYILIPVLLSFNNRVGHNNSVYTTNSELLKWANILVKHINVGNTDYRHKETTVSWGEGSDANAFKSYTDCSGFINSLIKQSMNKNDDFLKKWLGKSRPLAYHYFDAITSGNRFKKIENIQDIQPGDLLVIKYGDKSEHEDNTGHCMLVFSKPERRNSTKLIVTGTDQYEIVVIDSSKKPHGKSDTRHNEDGSDFPGLGQGVFRLYTNKAGKISGYSWSTLNPKQDFDPFANAIVAGRLEL